ncbi:MAG: YCF48-related protein [bacterium]
MQRLIRLTLLMVLAGIICSGNLLAQKPQAYVSGRIAPDKVRVFLKDSTYIIDRDLVVGGTLIIEPGSEILFYPNGRLIDSTGGRIIADGLARATYNPGSLNPLSPNDDYYGYADPNYFLNAGVVEVNTTEEFTVNRKKENYIYNVLLDVVNKTLVNLRNPDNTSVYGPYSKYVSSTGLVVGNDPTKVIISYEQAMMFIAGRLGEYNPPKGDSLINIIKWQRFGYKSVDIEEQQILFRGQPEGKATREYGHIVILPGARAAFFRNCKFDNFKKDVTVSRGPFYNDKVQGSIYTAINNKLNQMTNGAGGAIASLSSRTWLLECTFTNNMARNRGGALMMLQSPEGYPKTSKTLARYDLDKNPTILDPDYTASTIIEEGNYPGMSKLLKIDAIDETEGEPLLDGERQAFDDARLAVYLGRVRNLTFDKNFARLANTDTVAGIIDDDVQNPAHYPQAYGDFANGGAIYMAGEGYARNSSIEVALGCNNQIKIGGKYVDLYTSASNFAFDQFRATNNFAANYQDASGSEGARGGAIYLGKNTALILAGELKDNYTYTKYMNEGTRAASYSMGGGVYIDNSNGRFQLRGGPARTNDNPTYVAGNYAGAGGAIFIDGNANKPGSPIIGGSDVKLITRDWGFDIVIENNSATAFGGAIFTKRQSTINGAGGVEVNSLIGYGGKYPVKFYNNKAGFAGGAIESFIPFADPGQYIPTYLKTMKIARAEFIGNKVGESSYSNNNGKNDFAADVRGGGAVYAVNTELNEVKGTLFQNNIVYNGNGGALSILCPSKQAKRAFVTDLDQINHYSDGLVKGYTSNDPVFTYDLTNFPADARMLTRFIGNQTVVEDAVMADQAGTGTTQEEIGTKATTTQLLASHWTDASNGVAVGYGGEIIKLTNGGLNWQYITSGTKYRLEDVQFVSSSTGFAVGDHSVILKTTDGGLTWVNKNSDVTSTLYDVNFVGTNDGYAVGDGGVVYITKNGGETWTKKVITDGNLYGVSFTSKLVGYVVGANGYILKTVDGGLNWDYTPMIGMTKDLKSVFFVSATAGVAVGIDGTVIQTPDGGDTWNLIQEGLFQDDLENVFFLSTQTGYAAGKYGELYKTVNGGTTWAKLNMGNTWNIQSVYFPSPTTGYIVGDYGMIKKTVDGGTSWSTVVPHDDAVIDVVRRNADTYIPENGIGLGGAIFILDSLNWDGQGHVDTADMFLFNRVRIQNNKAYTGSAVYSDNFNLKLVFNRSLITKNVATSIIGKTQNVITGPFVRPSENILSSDLAPATLYGEIQGPLPANEFSEAANSIYDNDARFLIRLPDAPNTKGILTGSTGIGFGGTDTLRGNYWGETQANVIMDIVALSNESLRARMETFFVAGDPAKSWLPFLYPKTADPREQGPFESIGIYKYDLVPLDNAAGDVTKPGTMSIPEQLLFSGLVYDMYDKGTDIKTADYSKRRMSPIEDFAVGIPPLLKSFKDDTKPSFGKYVKKWARDPQVAEMRDPQGNLVYPALAALQTEWFSPDSNGVDHHPIGYPLYLEANVDYRGDENLSNNDPLMLNESVFFVINESNNDIVRVNLKQVGEGAPYLEVFRNTVELVPDSSHLAGYNNQNRYINRRLSEGLKTIGNGAELLRKLRRNAMNEDYSALQGRKYHADVKKLGLNENIQDMLVNKLFSNRPTMPTSNQDGNNSMTTFFAGERYRALPVKVGDTIRVISRTFLWRTAQIDDIDGVMKGGLKFVVSESSLPPHFTGDIPKLKNNIFTKVVPTQYPWRTGYDTLVVDEFANRIFITEDRTYPARNNEYKPGRDSILAVTAIDSVLLYDPSSVLQPTKFGQLFYEWEVDANSGLSYWLSVKQFAADKTKDNAKGYIQFQGKPINPFVVPGGEWVTVRAGNYPPSWRLVDKMKADGLSADLISKFVETFPPYFNATVYDYNPGLPTDNARFLQQDTIDFGSKYYQQYKFQIFVVDSAPRFIEFDETPETVKRIDDPAVDYVIYNPSVYPCSYPDDVLGTEVLIANVTDKLRFQVDINTDDECEDHSPAVTAKNPAWDYRYGMTAYGFMNLAIYNEGRDTIVIDDMLYEGESKFTPNDTMIVVQTRPEWMSNKYICKYGDDSNKDLVVGDFTTYGKLNIRIPKAEAMNLLNPIKADDDNETGYMINDTVFTVIANDGHSGLSTKQYPVYINYQPTITNDTLPTAIQAQDYNYYLDVYGEILGTRSIKVFDPNVDQAQKFELIYKSDVRSKIAKDPCFAEAGDWDLTGKNTTPNWLQINKESGVLYGTPGINDVEDPTINGGRITEMVTVLVTDENGLNDLKTLRMYVQAIAYKPSLKSLLSTHCVDKGGSFVDYLIVSDKDFLRSGDRVTIKVYNAETGDEVTSIKVDPAVINADDVNVKDTTITISSDNFQETPNTPDGKLKLIIVATDRFGYSDTLDYYIGTSLEVDFAADVTVKNANGSFQVLNFGTSSRQEASRGDGTDNPLWLGKLDYVFCEYELPPLPPSDVFDARWQIPTRTGTLRNIHPSLAAGESGRSVYEAKFQAGGVQSESSIFYPVQIKWEPGQIPTIGDATKNPAGYMWVIKDAGSNGQIFRARMDAPDKEFFNASNIGMTWDADNKTWVITVNRTDVTGFIIDYVDPVSVSQDGQITATQVTSVSPNPVKTSTNVTFTVLESSEIKLEVVDMLGNIVKVLENGMYNPGTYVSDWNGTDNNNNIMASGAYQVRLVSGNNVSTYLVRLVK